MSQLLPYRDLVGLQLTGDVSRLAVAIVMSLSTHAMALFSQLPAHHLGSTRYDPGTLEVAMVAAPQPPPRPAPAPPSQPRIVHQNTPVVPSQAPAPTSYRPPEPLPASQPEPQVELRREQQARLESSQASSAQQAPPLPSVAPEPLFAPQPDYPEEARWEERTGSTLLKFRIQADGTVQGITLLSSSGHADLDDSAMRSLRNWRFAPDQLAEERWYKHRFRFQLL